MIVQATAPQALLGGGCLRSDPGAWRMAIAGELAAADHGDPGEPTLAGEWLTAAAAAAAAPGDCVEAPPTMPVPRRVQSRSMRAAPAPPAPVPRRSGVPTAAAVPSSAFAAVESTAPGTATGVLLLLVVPSRWSSAVVRGAPPSPAPRPKGGCLRSGIATPAPGPATCSRAA